MKKRIKSLGFEVKHGSLDILKNARLISQQFFTSCNASIAVHLCIPPCVSSNNVLFMSSNWLGIF